MKTRRFQLRYGASSRPSLQRSHCCSLVVLLITSVGVGLHCLSSSAIQKYTVLLEFGHYEQDNDNGAAMMRNPRLRAKQLEGETNSTEFGPVIQVIHTRFMQFQPNFTELGLGRLLLFETFSLPTLLRQSSQNYLWIIRADPKLNEAVRQKFVDLVRPYSNIYFIASNNNAEGFRSSEYMDGIQPQSIWTGDYDMLLRAHQVAKTRLVVETRLDADDGLYTDFVSDIQKEAIKYLTRDKSNWKLWCSYVHMDWQLVSPWKDFDPEWGVLSKVQSPLCVTAGLTVGYGVKVKRSDFPGRAHQLMHKQMPPCDDSNGFVKCLSRFPRSKFSAIRARTVTSTAMGNVVLESKESQLTEAKSRARQKAQDVLWGELKDLFGITKEMTSSTRRSMMEKQSIIAAENLKGQCAKSAFTCRGKSRDLLQQVAIKNDKGVEKSVE